MFYTTLDMSQQQTNQVFNHFSFNSSLLRTYYMPDTVLAVAHSMVEGHNNH